MRNGRAMSKHPPFGLKRCDKALVVDAAEQAVLAEIIRLHTEGHSTGAIARSLNASQATCRGRCWHRETIRRAIARAGHAAPVQSE